MAVAIMKARKAAGHAGSARGKGPARLRRRGDYSAKGGWLGFALRLRAAAGACSKENISHSANSAVRHSAARSLHFSGLSIAPSGDLRSLK